MIRLATLRELFNRSLKSTGRYAGNRKSLTIRLLMVALFMTAPFVLTRTQHAQDVCAPSPSSGCFVSPVRDIAFIIDASARVGLRGQTYNIEVEGVRRALSDPTIVPRNGSVAVTVVVFNELPTVVVPFTEVTSEDIAQQIAETVEGLKCSDVHSLTAPCPFGATEYAPAIQVADITLRLGRNSNPKAGVSRVFIMASDGLTNDVGAAIKQVETARINSVQVGIPMEFDFILDGVDEQSPDFSTAFSTANQLVTPQPATTLPGATFVIPAGTSNLDGATTDDPDFSRQVNNLAEDTRTILRGAVTAIQPVVNSEIDTVPGTTVSPNGPLSLRQAIEQANCNGGATTISFDAGIVGKTIQLTSPLPPILMPDITIDGCTGGDCTPAVTLDGGGQVSDGIVIRSNRVTIRGMKIANFSHAGIVIAPQCPQDIVGHNQIEQNVIQGSPTGILVLDPASPVVQRTAASHALKPKLSAAQDGVNVQNKLSRNAISRPTPADGAPATALIDLGGDGPTPNDDGDTDTGPNTLLNFPDSLLVTAQDTTVSVIGKLNTPPPGGATVEIFGVTASHLVNDLVVTDGVTFLGSTTANANGEFAATGLTPSPTGIYTATVTDLPSNDSADQSANTSELMFDSASTPLPRPAAVFTTPVDFGTVGLNTPTTKPVTISNPGTAPLTVKGCTIGQCPGAASGNLTSFTVTNCPTGRINPGQAVTISVTFNATTCGQKSACLLLQSDDPKNPQIAISLTANASSPASAVVQGGVTQIKFKRQPPRTTPSANPVTKTFTVTNTGCDTLNLSSATFTRNGQVDTSGIFKLSPSGSAVSIPGGGSLTFTVSFDPVIPPVVGGQASVSDLLPDSISDTLTIGSISLPVIAAVKPRIRFINPTNPSQAPVISLCQSGDNFIVTFSAFDANTNLNRAVYQFKNSSGGNIGSPITVDNLVSVLQGTGIQKGQSFTLVQRFSGANDNKKVATVEVTIFDGESSTTATSSALGSDCSGVTSAAAVVQMPASKSLLVRRKRGTF